MQGKSKSFRVRKVAANLRGKVWYRCYVDGGQRRRPRVGPDREQARQMAAEINGQLEVGAPASLSYEPISVPELRQRWLDHHEHVRRSSLATINRYRTATEHLLTFIATTCPVRHACDFRSRQANEFVRYLRTVKVAPNGHGKARKRPLLDAGIKYILETCCSLFNYAHRNRHLSPYAENPFRMIEVSRMPIEDCRPIVVLNEDQEVSFLKACNDWQFPIFLTLMLTGMRPGELCRLLLPDDLDLDAGWLYVRNKPKLGWQVKTRNQRDIPLVQILVKVLRQSLAGRTTGPIFRQRRFDKGYESPLDDSSLQSLERELAQRIRRREAESDSTLSRAERSEVSKTIWRDLGAFDIGLGNHEPATCRTMTMSSSGNGASPQGTTNGHETLQKKSFQPSKIFRRRFKRLDASRFLAIAGGATGTLLFVDPTLAAEVGAGLPTHRVRVRRYEDLAVLEFSFVNFEARS